VNDSPKSRLFFITYGAANLGLVLYGLLALIKPGILLETFSLYVYEFPVEATLPVAYLAALFRLLGFFNLLLGGLGIALLWQYHRNRRRWIFLTVMSSSLFAYLAPIVFDNTIGHIGFFELLEHILFFTMLVAAMLMLPERNNQ
jgi:hypothetical protein